VCVCECVCECVCMCVCVCVCEGEWMDVAVCICMSVCVFGCFCGCGGGRGSVCSCANVWVLVCVQINLICIYYVLHYAIGSCLVNFPYLIIFRYGEDYKLTNTLHWNSILSYCSIRLILSFISELYKSLSTFKFKH